MEYDENKVLTEWNYSAPNIFYMQISINILLAQVTSCVFMMGETFGPQKNLTSICRSLSKKRQSYDVMQR